MRFREIGVDYCVAQKEEEHKVCIHQNEEIIYVTREGIFEGILKEIGVATDTDNDNCCVFVLKIIATENDKFVCEELVKMEDLVYICKKSDEQNKVREAYSYVVFGEYERLLKMYKQSVERCVKDLPTVDEVMKILADKWDCLTDEHKESVAEILEVVSSTVDVFATA